MLYLDSLNIYLNILNRFMKKMSREKKTEKKEAFLDYGKPFLFAMNVVLGIIGFQYILLSNTMEVSFVQEAHASVMTLTTTTCFNEDAESSTCQSAISADGGTEHGFTKNIHIDASFQTFEVASINSATLYYDARGTLSGSWAVYVKDARDGNIICSVDPAPENASETRNSLSCSITPTQLLNGVWFQADNNDGASPERIYLDYVYLSIDYNPAISITISTDGSVAFGILDANTTEDTTASGINDVETISVDSGPADLDVRASTFTDGTNTWTFASSSGANDVKFEFSKDGTAWTTILLANTLYALDTNVAQSATRSVYLKITTPTSTTSYSQYSTMVTVVASVP